MSAYTSLESRFRRIGAVRQAIAMLRWDSATMMPPGGSAARAEQLATLQVMTHEALTAPEMDDLLAQAEGEAAAIGVWQRANLREMRRRWLHAAAVPADLVAAHSHARSACEAVWRTARPANDFTSVLPTLDEVLRLTREVAAAKAARLGLSPYEALLDAYEPGGSTAEIDRLFGEIEGFLPDLLDGALARQSGRNTPPAPAGPFSVAAQRAASVALMERFGFDFARGRLDVSAHPFCGGTPDDIRITTRYDEADFATALMSTLHETGHALYERGLPPEWRLQPVGAARGMAMHESQSLFIEMQVCRSPEFARFAAPILRPILGGEGDAWEPEAFYRRQIRVRPGLIRVDADEITYPAHVIMRYRLERAMLAGDLAPADLPAAWRGEMQKRLGIMPPGDRDGCLQDIHWYDGLWGYFATYTIGALIAAQLAAAARAALPTLADDIAHGGFGPLLHWLAVNVHSKGSLLGAAETIAEATGRPLGTAAFERHLRERYLS
jgi:carboxypeptidase Taq